MSINSAKKSRGRPSVDSEAVNIRLSRAVIELLDARRGDETRQDAIRKLLALSLEHEHWAASGLHPVVVPLTSLERASLASWADGQPDVVSLPEAALRLIQAGLEKGAGS